MCCCAGMLFCWVWDVVPISFEGESYQGEGGCHEEAHYLYSFPVRGHRGA